ncbi:hypothetical protein NUSPORA_01590 [Nucleospora cyclopteri]
MIPDMKFFKIKYEKTIFRIVLFVLIVSTFIILYFYFDKKFKSRPKSIKPPKPDKPGSDVIPTSPELVPSISETEPSSPSVNLELIPKNELAPAKRPINYNSIFDNKTLTPTTFNLTPTIPVSDHSLHQIEDKVVVEPNTSEHMKLNNFNENYRKIGEKVDNNNTKFTLIPYNSQSFIENVIKKSNIYNCIYTIIDLTSVILYCEFSDDILPIPKPIRKYLHEIILKNDSRIHLFSKDIFLNESLSNTPLPSDIIVKSYNHYKNILAKYVTNHLVGQKSHIIFNDAMTKKVICCLSTLLVQPRSLVLKKVQCIPIKTPLSIVYIIYEILKASNKITK